MEVRSERVSTRWALIPYAPVKAGHKTAQKTDMLFFYAKDLKKAIEKANGIRIDKPDMGTCQLIKAGWIDQNGSLRDIPVRFRTKLLADYAPARETRA